MLEIRVSELWRATRVSRFVFVGSEITGYRVTGWIGVGRNSVTEEAMGMVEPTVEAGVTPAR